MTKALSAISFRAEPGSMSVGSRQVHHEAFQQRCYSVKRLDAGHLAWEEAADQYGGLVVDWVKGGYRRIAAG